MSPPKIRLDDRLPVATPAVQALASAGGKPRGDVLRLSDAEIELLRREFVAPPAWRDLFRAAPRAAA